QPGAAEWRHDAWAVIAGARHLDWMVLTKRPENIAKMLPVMDSSEPGYRPWNERWPWQHVWLGTTIEDRARLHRLDKLRAAPAVVRFLSIEPLLEDLGEVDLSGIHLVIVGGESGPHARPLNPAWVRSLRDQCAAQGSAFFLKQWGEWADMATARIAVDGPVMTRAGIVPNWMDRAVTFADGSSARLRGHTFTGHGTDLVFRVGKKAAGRLLDGVEHNGFPEVARGRAAPTGGSAATSASKCRVLDENQSELAGPPPDYASP
ncbi:DUF5131 family protein, partial [Methylobacterium sp. B1]|uniref:DUF5131 family protein n=1 Tax=Methylobacterium sp. B1 TaxID=91459 RepID=UPI00068656A0